MSKFECGWPNKTYIDGEGKSRPTVCPCGWVFPDKLSPDMHERRDPQLQLFAKPVRRERLITRERL